MQHVIMHVIVQSMAWINLSMICRCNKIALVGSVSDIPRNLFDV